MNDIAKAFTHEEYLRAYALRNDLVYFLFDQRLYNCPKVGRVVLTADFTGWHPDMNEERWQLRQVSEYIWILPLDNTKLIVHHNNAFKYRVNHFKANVLDISKDHWINPLPHAGNIRNQNWNVDLYYKPLRLRAEIKRQKTIWAKIEGFERPLLKEDYRLLDASGTEIEIASVLPNTASETLIVPHRYLDIRRAYFLEIPSKALRVHCSYDGWFRELYSEKELGANVSEDGSYTIFRIFAPRATALKLYLYKHEDDTKAYATINMQVDPDGVWETLVPENLHGVYYDFTVHGHKDPGNHFYESVPVHISDPYARVSVDTWGKCRVWKKNKPAKPLKQKIHMKDLIAYEVHVQDFTDLLPIEDKYKGTFEGMIIPNLKDEKGNPLGFDYLVNLGFNVLHLMPVQEYLHYPDDEWKKSFENDEYMKALGINTQNYQWGYRTSHAFAVETRYRTKGTEHGTQREQFKKLVDAFHEKGIAVIIDIVPNHTAENMDGQDHFFHFNSLDKIYYYRTRNLQHIGEYGNEVKTENRPMVQRWLIDQCKHFIEEFGIDGFRIDLAGQIDEQTLKSLRENLGEDIIIYGEPWIGSKDPDFENNPDWDWYKQDSPITFFQDDARNYFKGPTSEPYDKFRDRGYAGGNSFLRDGVKMALANKFPEETHPLKGISYLDIHDNMCLADRFARSSFDGRYGVDEERVKIAAVLLYTSLGPIVTHGGTEILRSKGLGEKVELVKETISGVKVYIHGKKDTYNLRAANQFIWENIGKNKSDGAYCNYQNMYEFWRGLNQFRLSQYGEVFRKAEAVPEHYYSWYEPADRHFLGYLVDQKILVLLNVAEYGGNFHHVWIPDGKWLLIADIDSINHQTGVSQQSKYAQLQGNNYYDFYMPATSLLIWVKITE